MDYDYRDVLSDTYVFIHARDSGSGFICYTQRSSVPKNLPLLRLQNSDNGSTDACITCSNGYVRFHFNALLEALSWGRRQELEDKVQGFLLEPTMSSDPRIISAKEVLIEDMCSVLFLLYTGATMMTGRNNDLVETKHLKRIFKNILDVLKVDLGDICVTNPPGGIQIAPISRSESSQSWLFRILQSIIPGIGGLHLKWGRKLYGRVEEFKIDVNGTSQLIRSMTDVEQPSFYTGHHSRSAFNYNK